MLDDEAPPPPMSPQPRRPRPAGRVAPKEGLGHLTRVYVDPTAVVLGTAEPEGAEGHAAPGAEEAIRYLVDAGFDVILLGEADTPPFDAIAAGVTYRTDLPEHLEPDAWYLTGDPYPRYGRPRGGTTVLVGPKRAAGPIPLPRFDLETRDLQSATMEILTRQAMA